MGFIITIGNAEPWHEKVDGELKSGWHVKHYTNTFAPNLPNDDYTQQSNCRRPSYTAWREFLEETNLQTWFHDLEKDYDSTCVLLTQDDLNEVRETLNEWKKHAVLPPGFKKDDYKGPLQYDHNLARLIWLEWWIDWALKNCENPAIEIIR